MTSWTIVESPAVEAGSVWRTVTSGLLDSDSRIVFTTVVGGGALVLRLDGGSEALLSEKKVFQLDSAM
jgi:hypothetical protein